MKKELLIASVFAATIAGAGSVTTSNMMGYVPVEGAPSAAVADGYKMYMVVAPFEGYDAGQQISLAEVIQTAGLSENDEIFIPIATGYANYKLNGSKSWVASKNVTIASDGTVTEISGTPAASAMIARGKGFWVKTKATSLSLFGNAVTAATQVSAVAGDSKFAWTMIGSTLNGPIAISNLSGIGAQGDVIVLANGTRYTKGVLAWRNTTSGKPVELTDSDKIPAGVGFWYASKSGLQDVNL